MLAPSRTPGLLHRLASLAPRAHYGWVVLATLAVTETVSWGIVYYGFPVLLRSMETDLRASRVAITGAFSLGLGVSAVGAIPVGRWLDHHGPRALMTGGSCLATILMILWSRVDSLPALYAVWAAMGVALAAILYEPAFVAVVQWFTTERDRALLVLTLVAGLASTIFMPIEAWLVARVGWRAALLTLAMVLGVVTIPLHALVLRPAPKRADPGSRTAGATGSDAGLRVALGTVVFWVLAIAFVIGSFATVTVTVHLIPYLIDRGYGAAIAAATIGWMGAMQLPGRLCFVPIAAWLGPRSVTASIFLAQAAGVVAITLVSLLGVAPVIVLMGAANGMLTLARATVVAEVFGRRHYGSISGAMALGANAARAIGPVSASLLRIALGSYDRVFWLLGGTLALVALGVVGQDLGASETVESLGDRGGEAEQG